MLIFMFILFFIVLMLYDLKTEVQKITKILEDYSKKPD